MKREEIEVMAPVGSYESLMGAIQGGANSVYFGVEKLNMRAGSSVNFTLDDLRNIASICDENGVKSYLTVNTILYDDDLPKMREIVDAAKQSGISAIIASDQAAIRYARSIGVEVHISTQISISNSEVVRFYSDYADVMVLARELSLDKIKHIAETIEKDQIKGPKGELIRIEIFVHGAFCMAISGKCYLSLHEQNQSANRGACRQTCRKAYVVTEIESGYQLEIDNEYIMSPKDLCTIGFVDKIIESGVKVFKIEGRARSAEYVKWVSQCYREAIDSYFDGTYNEEKIKVWKNKLKSVFNRGFWDGYYQGQTLGEWNDRYGSVATKQKIYVGKITNYFAKIGVAEVKIEAHTLSLNEEIIITGPTTGVVEETVSEIRLDLGPVPEAKQGDLVSIPVSTMVRRADKLYKMVNKAN
jgi:U32 family peptidase